MEQGEHVSDQCLDFLKRMMKRDSSTTRSPNAPRPTFRRPPRRRRKGGVTVLNNRPKMGSMRSLRKYLTLSDNKVQKLLTGRQSSTATTAATPSGSGVMTRAARRRLATQGQDDMDDMDIYAPLTKKKKDGNVLETLKTSKGKVPDVSTSRRKSPNTIQTDPLISTDDYDKSNDQSAMAKHTQSESIKGDTRDSMALNRVSDNSECTFERGSALILDDQFCSFAVDNIKQQNEKHQKTIHFLQSLLTIHSHHLGE